MTAQSLCQVKQTWLYLGLFDTTPRCNRDFEGVVQGVVVQLVEEPAN